MNRDPLAAIKEPAGVVLGLGQNGLATVRALGRRGVPVIGIDANVERPTAHSRYCRPVRSLDFRTGGRGLLDSLREIGEQLRERAVLFPSGDLNLRVVSEHRDELARYYRISLPDAATVDLILDKRRFYDFASENGFPIPATIRVDDTNVRDVAGSIRYPVILKPSLRDVAWRKEDGAKAYEVDTPDALVSTWARLAPLSDTILAQELIDGPDSQLSFSLTYLDDQSQPLAMFTGRKLRQYPPRFGTSSMAESRWDSEVASLSVKLLRALRYRGYASVEFKRDMRDGGLRIIEVTGRTWYPHGIATACGVNLPYLAYCHLLGRPLDAPGTFAEGVKWIDEDRDIRSALAEHRAGRLSVADWIGSYRGRRTYAIFAPDDPGPMLHLLARTARAAFRRVRPRRAPTVEPHPVGSQAGR
jgi:predicted ATP-grasp superfamily ATP-dependent carboligase